MRIAAAAAALLTAIFALVLAFPPTRDIETAIDIDAPPARIWAILTDTASYPQWNPEIAALIGDLKPGAVVENRLGTGADQIIFHPTILAATPERELSWQGQLFLPRLFDAKHEFLLRPAPLVTHFIQAEHVRGILLWLFDPAPLISRMNAMNAALKHRAEQLH